MFERCCGASHDGDACQCMVYSPPERPLPGKSLMCEECGHGRSNHPVSSIADPSNAKKSLLKAFNEKAGARLPETSMERGANTSMDDARRESLSGFREKPSKKVRTTITNLETEFMSFRAQPSIEHKIRKEKVIRSNASAGQYKNNLQG
jgi:hypothetical protein